MKNLKKNILSQAELEVPGMGYSLYFSFEIVTPEIAKKWLDENEKTQRTINDKTVVQYSNQVKKLLWFFANGESIKFDDEGLADGQHRLSSCVHSGENCIFLIIRGLKSDQIESMDQGKKRSLNDILKVYNVEPIEGLSNSMLASVLNGIYVSRHYALAQRSSTSSLRVDRIRGGQPSPVELYEFLKANPSIISQLEKLRGKDLSSVRKHAGLAPSLVGWFLVSMIDQDIADKIWLTLDECVPQTSQGKNCPAFTMFQHIQKAKVNQVTITKHLFPGMWLWAADNMLRGSTPKELRVQAAQMPGQGHEGTLKLVTALKELKDVR